MKFKVGDKVKLVVKNGNEPRYGWGNVKPGDEGVIAQIQSDGDLIVEFEQQSYWSGVEKEFVLVTKHSVKPKPVHFLLKYDLDVDPIEEFETMKEVNDRIKELMNRSDLKRDSMVVYEIKKKSVVKVDTKISLKAV